MKIDLTQSRKDWMIYVLMALVSAVLHLILTLVLLSVPVQGDGESPAIEAHLANDSVIEAAPEAQAPEGPDLRTVLQNWKAEMQRRERAIALAVEARVEQLEKEGSQGLEDGWTITNVASRMKTMCLSLGVDLQAVEVQETSNRYDIRLRLGGQEETVFRDLALLAHLTGAATRKSRFKSNELQIEVVDSTGIPVGQFQLPTSKSRDYQRGQLSLTQLFGQAF